MLCAFDLCGDIWVVLLIGSVCELFTVTLISSISMFDYIILYCMILWLGKPRGKGNVGWSECAKEGDVISDFLDGEVEVGDA